MGIRKEIREGKDMKESEQIYANLNMKKTGENIRSRRERLGMNRPDIQKKMGLAGVQSVWNWEKGKKMPNIENLFALAEILLFFKSMCGVVLSSAALTFSVDSCS